MKQSGVYKITNTLSGKFYIGSSVDISTRWKQHRYDFNQIRYKTRSHLHDAVRKYGIDNFRFEIVEEIAAYDKSRKHDQQYIQSFRISLIALEQYYIDLLRPVYNLCPIAGSRLGSKMTLEQVDRHRVMLVERWKDKGFRTRMSEIQQRRMTQTEWRQFYRDLRLGKTWEELFGEHAQEIKARRSESRKNYIISEETRQKISQTLQGNVPWNKGKTWDQLFGIENSQKAKEKLSAALMGKEAWNKGIPWSDEMKQKLSEAHIGQSAWNKGVPMSDDQKALLSDIATERLKRDPELQTRMTEAARQVNLGTPRSDETKNNISINRRGKQTGPRVPHSEDTRHNISEALQSSEKFKSSVEARTGKTRSDNTSGHYGITWDKSKNKWQVRVNKKFCGRFDNIDDAIIRRDQALTSLNTTS